MTNSKIVSREDEIKARLDVTTSGDILRAGCGDWYYTKISDYRYSIGVDEGDARTEICIVHCLEDAEFIINTKPDTKWLLHRIKALEEDNVRLGEAFEPELRDKVTYHDMSKEQHKRIKELEAENDDLKLECSALKDVVRLSDGCFNREQELRKTLETELLELKLSGGRDYDAAVIAAKQLSRVCARYRVVSKWSRRWKRLAKQTIDREEAFRHVVHEDHLHQLDVKSSLVAENLKLQNRISALENAERRCDTCIYDGFDRQQSARPNRCHVCLNSNENRPNWVLDEKRFMPKEDK